MPVLISFCERKRKKNYHLVFVCIEMETIGGPQKGTTTIKKSLQKSKIYVIEAFNCHMNQQLNFHSTTFFFFIF